MRNEFLKETAQGVDLAINLQPRASKQRVIGVHGTELKVSVTAPPVDAAANRALLLFMADLFHVPRSGVELVKGQTSRHKIIRVKGVKSIELMERLVPYLE